MTYPGHLVISGDIGTYVFARLNDMFEFFRSDEMKINVGYYSEKLKSVSKFGGENEFCDKLWRSNVIEWFNHWEENESSESIKREVWERVKNEMIPAYSKSDAELNLINWQSEHLHINFEDGLPAVHHAMQSSSQLILCLFAIVWGIQQYDKHHANLMEKRQRLADEREQRDRLYTIYREDVEGAPFKIGQFVKVGKEKGIVQFLDYSGGCGESYPDDPMISVDVDDAYSEGGQGMFWKEELEAFE